MNRSFGPSGSPTSSSRKVSYQATSTRPLVPSATGIAWKPSTRGAISNGSPVAPGAPTQFRPSADDIATILGLPSKKPGTVGDAVQAPPGLRSAANAQKRSPSLAAHGNENVRKVVPLAGWSKAQIS